MILGHFGPRIVHFEAITDSRATRRAHLAQARPWAVLGQAAQRAGFVTQPQICLSKAFLAVYHFITPFTPSAMARCLILLTSEPLWIGEKRKL